MTIFHILAPHVQTNRQNEKIMDVNSIYTNTNSTEIEYRDSQKNRRIILVNSLFICSELPYPFTRSHRYKCYNQFLYSISVRFIECSSQSFSIKTCKTGWIIAKMMARLVLSGFRVYRKAFVVQPWGECTRMLQIPAL